MINIAIISYEYPAETGGGGIGTFLINQTPGLIELVDELVIFCGTNKTEPYWENDHVYRIPCTSARNFNEVILPYFEAVHVNKYFNLIEGSDYLAWGLEIKKAFPNIPLVVRLHTPLYLIDLLQFKPLTVKEKLRFTIGALRRFKLPHYPATPNQVNYHREFEILELADAIISPSKSIRNKLIELKMLDKNKTHQIIPFGFDISPEFLAIKSKSTVADGANIVYIGRLEIRKGVLELAAAIPEILKKFPKCTFTFVGQSTCCRTKNSDMREYLEKNLKVYMNKIFFTGKIPHSQMIHYFKHGDIFVYPSHYESFGIACCEALVAGKAVIGSKNGGMDEIIVDGESGLTILPSKTNIIIAVTKILNDNQIRVKLGINARERMTSHFDLGKIIKQNVVFYQSVIWK